MLLSSLLLSGLLAISPDTIYTRGLKIACTVKEVSEEQIRYIYPGEEALNTIYAKLVEKIVFAVAGVAYAYTLPTVD